MEQLGRYQILAELGRGAMGIVYRALDPAIGRPVAIKTIRLKDISDEAERGRLRDRLFREAQSAGLLSHPGIVTIYDVGEQGETTYIAMEFVDGPTLEKLMSADTPLEPQQVMDILRQTATALDYAHKKGIIHRDIKPANIMVCPEGGAKITDFGVAKISQSQQMTHPGMVLGTPNYMSPEQVRGKPVDGRADQFALAVMAYEMLTGEKPFPGDTLTTVLYKIVSEEPTPPQNLNPSLPWALAMVLGRGLSKDPERRFPSATEFVTALEGALANKKGWKPLARGASHAMPTAIAPGPMASRPASATDATIVSPSQSGRRGGMRWKLPAVVLGAVALVAVLFAVGQQWLIPSRQAGTEAPTPPAAQPRKPTPMPEGAAGRPTARPDEGTTRPVDSPPLESSQPVATPKPRPQGGAPTPTGPQTYALQFTTSPPGAVIGVDHDTAKACTTPCALTLEAGRHVVEIGLDGYRKEMRIVDLASPRELFVNLTRPTGTVRVESKPPGAQIAINGEVRREVTPATFVLPVGKYTFVISKDGRKGEQEIELKDGSLTRFELDLNP